MLSTWCSRCRQRLACRAALNVTGSGSTLGPGGLHELQEKLDAAVEQEDYTAAAALRDELRSAPFLHSGYSYLECLDISSWCGSRVRAQEEANGRPAGGGGCEQAILRSVQRRGCQGGC